jgi:GT2 family glycosyltransferase
MAHLPACLEALERQTLREFEVIVVDNGSHDGSPEYLRQSFPRVCSIELGRNLGFTGACLAGYAIAQGQFVVLLNNDTEADPGWLEALAQSFDDYPRAGSIASKILLHDQRYRFHSAGDFYRLDGIPGNRGVWEQDAGQYEREEPVFSACGAAAAYRREMLDEIGFLDDDFYFSCEDVDMGWRAHLAGWEVIYQPRAVVFHKLKATGGNVTGSYYDGRNFLYVLWKDYPWSLWKRHWRRIARAQLNIALDALGAFRGAAARARLRGQIAGLLGLPKMLHKREEVQRNRCLSDESLMVFLSPVDSPRSGR